MSDEFYNSIAVKPTKAPTKLDFCPEDELTLPELHEQNIALQAKLDQLIKASKKPAKKKTTASAVVEIEENAIAFSPKKTKSFLKEVDTLPNGNLLWAVKQALQKCQTTGLIKPVTKDLKLPSLEMVLKLVDNSHNKASALLTQLNKISGYSK